MACSYPAKSVKIDERSVKEQEYRKISRQWNRIVKKHSSSATDAAAFDEANKRGVRFGGPSPCPEHISGMEETRENLDTSGAALQRRMAKMKTFAKRKSPLKKFDEIVTRELTNRQFAENESLCSFDKSQKWMPNLEYSFSRILPFGRKVSPDTQVSKTTLSNVEKELKNRDRDPTDIENADLMDAIEKLIQAQASFRFDAAVKAADAAASCVPIELAEEVAISSARDYQSEIVDIVNEKVGGGDGKKPMEVIGYIGITKRKEATEDE